MKRLSKNSVDHTGEDIKLNIAMNGKHLKRRGWRHTIVSKRFACITSLGDAKIHRLSRSIVLNSFFQTAGYKIHFS